MAGSIQTYCYDGKKSFTLVKWKIRRGSQLFGNSVILSYRQEDGSTIVGKEPLLKYKSNVGGTVSELVASEGDIIHSGAELLKVEPCTHPVIMKDLCAECGTDLRDLDRDKFEKITTATTFSMVHIVPELKVSLEQAEKLGRDDENRLLNNKKLVLLVDLDQTLIHTTNDNVPEDLPDVHHFQLYGSHSPWYHTKLRPGTQKFLENISKYYELHICTFGARLYAHKIAEILDKDKKFFSHRILSRDECFDATSKTGNLKALFPRGENMVCIIDDREDVWNFAPNVIHVKPYTYFRNTGDINAPSSFSSKETQSPKPTENVSQIAEKDTTPSPIASSNKSPVPDNANKVCDEKQNGIEDSSTLSVSDSSTPDAVTASNSKLETPSNQSNNEKKAEEGKDKKSEDKEDANKVSEETINSYWDANHADDYLLYLEEILITVHKSYYDMYSNMQKDSQKGIPDLKMVVPHVRSKVLKNMNIVFSSVIPTNGVPESHYFWTLAESLGAQVSRELEFDDLEQRTTHVVSSKPGTVKVNAAKKHKGIHIVSLEWLMCCAERWEHADERLFPLAKEGLLPTSENDNSMPSFSDAVAGKARERKLCGFKRRNNRKEKVPLNKEQLKIKEDKFSERIFVEAGLSLSKDDIEDMDREIDEACSEESADENTKASTSSESSSSVESLSSGDYPRGWKKKRKVEIQDMEQGEAEESSDAETIGSVDEEMADAVKKEFGNF